MHPAARGVVTFIAWTATTVVLAPVCFIVGVILAGPHSDVLPSLLQPPVLVLAWLVLLVAPLWVARGVWQRAGRGRLGEPTPKASAPPAPLA